MKPYSILIKGTGPCGTGEKNSSADLLAQTLAQTLNDAGHQVTHASIVTDTETLLLHGELTVHPEPHPEKKGGAQKKKAAAALPPKPAGKPNGHGSEPTLTPEEASEENGTPPSTPPNPESDLATDPA